MPKALLLFFIFLIGFSAFHYAHADGIGVTPKRLVIQDGQRFVDVTLVNSSATRQHFEIAIMNKRMNSKGQLADTENPADGEFFADKMIRFTPRSVDIAPGQSQKVRILSRLSENAPDGEYRSHMLFKQIADETRLQSALYAISIPVILRKGSLSASFTLSNPKIFTQDEKRFMSFDINRQGNKSLYGDVSIYVHGDKIAPLNGVATYLSVPSRTVTIEIPNTLEIMPNSTRIVFTTDDQSSEIVF